MAHHRSLLTLLWAIALLLPTISPTTSAASAELPPLVFVARGHLVTPDAIFTGDLGPPGQLTTSLDSFAPGSKLMIRRPDGALLTLLDTARPAGDQLNPLGLADLQQPDVAFDARQIVFAASFGPTRAAGRVRCSWRLFTIAPDGKGLRQLTRDDRRATIPGGAANADVYGFYDDLMPAFLADGRVVFSSTRYPSRSHYDGRPSYNLYTVDVATGATERITTERGGALHPAALPDGRIAFSRWWVNFNQPSETGIFSRIDNAPGGVPARDTAGRPIVASREVIIQDEPPPVSPTSPPPTAALPPTATPRPTIWPTAPPAELRLTPGALPPTATPTAAPSARAAPTPVATAASAARPSPRTITVERVITGHVLPDGTLIYSNTVSTFRPARARLADGTAVRDAPNTWHLMSVVADGTDMRRLAWTPRYAGDLTDDGGLDTFNATQPAPILVGDTLRIAYVTQRDSTMAHTSLGTGIRIAYPGIAQMARNTTDSIAGMRWDAPNGMTAPFALAPAALDDGRIVFAQSVEDATMPQHGSYRVSEGARSFTLRLQGAPRRYTLRLIGADGAAGQDLGVDLGSFDALDPVALAPRPIGDGPGMWRMPARSSLPPPADDPAGWNVPLGLIAGDGGPAYPWSARQIGQVRLATLENTNVYANPPLEAALINSSPSVGSVAFADIYIDAPQFGGLSSRSGAPDDQVRAVKWLTVPVDPRGHFIASVPADTPAFVVLRDASGRIVRGGDRHTLSIAQGNTAARVGTTMRCTGCHLGHASGSVDGEPLAELGWTNIAPSAAVSASGGDAMRLIDRRGYVMTPGGGYTDRTGPWVASASGGASARLAWRAPMALLGVRLVGAEPGEAGFSGSYAISGELRFYLGATELAAARQRIASVAPLSGGGTFIRLSRPVAADRMTFTVDEVAGTRDGRPAPAALSEIEVIGQMATPSSLATNPSAVTLPLVYSAP